MKIAIIGATEQVKEMIEVLSNCKCLYSSIPVASENSLTHLYLMERN